MRHSDSGVHRKRLPDSGFITAENSGAFLYLASVVSVTSTRKGPGRADSKLSHSWGRDRLESAFVCQMLYWPEQWTSGGKEVSFSTLVLGGGEGGG